MQNILLFLGLSYEDYKLVESTTFNTLNFILSTESFPQDKVQSHIFIDADGKYDAKKIKTISDTTCCDGNLDFLENGINIYKMNVFSHLKLLENLGEYYAVSCCRESLTKFYIPLLNNLSCFGTIISLDKSISKTKKTKEIRGNCRIFFGVAHCNDTINYVENAIDDSVNILAERYGYLYFPAKCTEFKKFFKTSLRSPVSIYYAKNKRDFFEAVQKKTLNINVLHTLVCFEVKLLYPNQYNSFAFRNVSADVYSYIKKRVLAIYQEMYLSLFGQDEEYITAISYASSFIDDLQKYNEKCTRGVDFDEKSSFNKAMRHIRFVKDAGIDISRYSSITNLN